MKLLYSPTSPYVRKVMVTAHELGLVDRFEKEAVSGTPLAPNADVIAANPVGRIPTLILDDGSVLVDSRVICRYFNHLAGGALYGAGAAEFPIIAREALAEGMIDSTLLCSYENRLRPEEIRFQPFVDGQRAKVLRAAQGFERRLDELGGDLTIDKIVLGVALGYADLRLGDLGWRDSCPGLAEWYAAFAERPSMQATVPVG